MRLAALAVVLLSAAPARAEKVVAVLSADHGAYREALDGFQAAHGSSVPVRLASGDVSLDADTRVVVAIGGLASLRAYPPKVTVVYCLAPLTDLGEARGTSTRVRMMPRPEALISSIKAAQPKARALGILWSHSSFRGYVEAVMEQGGRANLKVLSLQLETADLPRTLRSIEGRVDAIWLAPDPMLVTPGNFKQLSRFARAAHVAFYAPTQELVQEGATAAIGSTPAEVGRTAALVVARALAGETPEEEVYPASVDDTAGAARAPLIGLSISTTGVKGAEAKTPRDSSPP